MKTDTLIIVDALLEPPSEPWAFRTVTMMAHEKLFLNVLLHTSQDMKDLYYQFMKPRGLMDYVDYILSESEWENGIRIDTIGVYPRCIVVKAIRLENQMYLMGRIKSMIKKE